MIARIVRFSPPRIEPSPELAWVLRRAFGPAEGALPGLAAGLGDPARGRAHDLAARLGLSPRIASRIPRAPLAAEVGEEPAARFHRDRAAAAASGLALRALAEQVAALAAELALPIVLLKHAALEALGILAPGSRAAADLDLLAPSGRAAELHGALVARGFRASASAAMEHQLPALVGRWGAVDVHRVVLGVRLGKARRSATCEELAAAGLLQAVPGSPEGVTVPRSEVLAAHVLVHALAQHGYAPHAYPGLRMVADLLDLGWGGSGPPSPGTRSEPERGKGATSGRPAARAGGRSGRGTGERDPVARAGRLIEREVRPAEVEAARGLCRALAAGDLAALEADPRASGEAALLHHLLAGALDPDYRRALRFPMLARPLTDRSRLGGAWRGLAGAVLPTRPELEVLYGAGGGRLGRMGRRLRRPFDLLARAARYAAGAARLRRATRLAPIGGGEPDQLPFAPGKPPPSPRRELTRAGGDPSAGRDPTTR